MSAEADVSEAQAGPPFQGVTCPRPVSPGRMRRSISDVAATAGMVQMASSFLQRDQLIQSKVKAALSRTQAAAPQGTESLDFDLHEKNQLRATAELPRNLRRVLLRRRTWLSHLFIVVMGVLVGLIAYALSRAVVEMSKAKWAWVREAVHEGRFYEGWLGPGWQKRLRVWEAAAKPARHRGSGLPQRVERNGAWPSVAQRRACQPLPPSPQAAPARLLLRLCALRLAPHLLGPRGGAPPHAQSPRLPSTPPR